MIKKFWEHIGIYAGILGLVVDCITLWGFVEQRLKIGELNGFHFTIPFLIQNYPIPVNYHKLILITTAALLIFGYLILIIFLPRYGFPHLSDEFTVEPYTTPYGETESNPFISAFKFGIWHQKQHIGAYSFLVNFVVISPIALLWLRAFFFFPSDNYIFGVSFVALILGAISTLIIPKYPKIKEAMWIIIFSEILILLIIAFGFTDWNFTYSLYISFLNALAVIPFLLFAKALKNRIVLFSLSHDLQVTTEVQMEFIKWLAERNGN